MFHYRIRVHPQYGAFVESPSREIRILTARPFEGRIKTTKLLKKLAVINRIRGNEIGNGTIPKTAVGHGR
jgi:hypothetical protein